MHRVFSIRGLSFTGVSGPVKILGALLAACAVGIAAAALLGIAPVLPGRFLLALLLFALPMAYAISVAVGCLDRVGTPRTLVPLSVSTGILFLALADIQSQVVIVVALVVLVSFLWHLWKSPPEHIRTLALAAVILVLGFAAIRNLNYIAALLTAHRLHDAVLRDVDLKLYAWLYGGDVQYLALFPLFRSPTVFHFLENAYSALFVQLIALALTFVDDREKVIRILSGVFLCYFSGIVIFFLFPAVGPCIIYPESFADAYRSSITGTVMQNLAAEYRAAVQGGTVNGLGYFIAVPSLHVAIATLCQLIFAARPALFWLFLPVNVMLALSTVALGYHYVVDVPAGVAVGSAVYLLWARPRSRTP